MIKVSLVVSFRVTPAYEASLLPNLQSARVLVEAIAVSNLARRPNSEWQDHVLSPSNGMDRLSIFVNILRRTTHYVGHSICSDTFFCSDDYVFD
jgi:hypothetical protein